MASSHRARGAYGTLAMPAGDLPAALYDYFAEELYQAAEPGLRWGLCQLAIPPSIDLELAQFLFGKESADLVLEHAVRLGVVASNRGTFELHPLLRGFLETKLDELGRGVAYPAVEKIVEFLIDRKRWDEAFSLALQFGVPGATRPPCRSRLARSPLRGTGCDTRSMARPRRRNFARDHRYSISRGLKSHSEKLRIPGPRASPWRLHQPSAPTIPSHRRRSCELARALISRHAKRLPLSITAMRR